VSAVGPFTLLLAPSLLGALLALVAPSRRAVGWAGGVLSLVAMVGALRLCAAVLAGEVPVAGPGGLLRADALSALLALCVSGVAALSELL
jgi:NADH:ubiquinone oxidoreductase subunit 5 (subunit L)/multisubunit Na+/H+ antiporter MnhA subunit